MENKIFCVVIMPVFVLFKRIFCYYFWPGLYLKPTFFKHFAILICQWSIIYCHTYVHEKCACMVVNIDGKTSSDNQEKLDLAHLFLFQIYPSQHRLLWSLDVEGGKETHGFLREYHFLDTKVKGSAFSFRSFFAVNVDNSMNST